MIDEGELDWKIVAVSSSDPRCELVNDVEDLEEHFPGQLSAIREWSRTYKTHDGKPLNAFELNEAFVGQGLHHGRDSRRPTGSGRASWPGPGRAEGSGKVAVGDVPIITGCFRD